jgi:flagellar protein FlbD
MITLHRLGHIQHELHINPDLIVTIEAHPDTVITLANGAKLVVSEGPDQVAAEVRAYRVDVLAGALRTRRETGDPAPHAPVGLHLAPAAGRDA